MNKIKRILVAVDFSAVSANALRHATALARQLGAALDGAALQRAYDGLIGHG